MAANEKISAMPSATELQGDELISSVQGGDNVSITPAQISTYIGGGGSGDVVGPGSAVDSNFAAFDTTTGKLIKDSGSKASDFQTPLSKASGTELDTGTDDAKFATAKAIKDSKNVPSVAPGAVGNVLTSDGTDWTSAAGGGGGTEYQIYDYLFWIDSPNTSSWFFGLNSGVGNEINSNTGKSKTSSILINMLDNHAFANKYIGIAQGAQTIETIRLHFGLNNTLTHFALLKITMNAGYATINSKADIWEGEITPDSQGYVNFVTSDLADATLADKDILIMFFGTSGSLDIYPCSIRVKCSID